MVFAALARAEFEAPFYQPCTFPNLAPPLHPAAAADVSFSCQFDSSLCAPTADTKPDLALSAGAGGASGKPGAVPPVLVPLLRTGPRLYHPHT